MLVMSLSSNTSVAHKILMWDSFLENSIKMKLWCSTIESMHRIDLLSFESNVDIGRDSPVF